MPTIGQLVSTYRENAGLTREQLATATGLSKGYIADLEQDRYADLSTATLKLLRAALPGLKCDELLDAVPADPSQQKRRRGRPPKKTEDAAGQ